MECGRGCYPGPLSTLTGGLAVVSVSPLPINGNKRENEEARGVKWVKS